MDALAVNALPRELGNFERAIVERLTPRERQIAEATVRGLTNREIGLELGISAETVKRHLATIYGKLALSGRVALAVHVLQSRAA